MKKIVFVLLLSLLLLHADGCKEKRPHNTKPQDNLLHLSYVASAANDVVINFDYDEPNQCLMITADEADANFVLKKIYEALAKDNRPIKNVVIRKWE